MTKIARFNSTVEEGATRGTSNRGSVRAAREAGRRTTKRQKGNSEKKQSINLGGTRRLSEKGPPGLLRQEK